MSTTAQALTAQIYQVFIKASPEQIWEGITTPEFTSRYFHGAQITVTASHYTSHGLTVLCGATNL